jgi:adenosylhomocysteine nucleosidase
MTFELKSVSGKSILFVMAVEAEYGSFLRSRIEPLMTGVGPVEAAIALTRTLAKLEQENERPDLVVSLGSAGSARLEQTEIYQASSVSYRDMDASPLGFEKGRTPFLDLPAALELPLRIPGVPTTSLSTGANIVSGATYDTIDADMVDMETFAVLRTCHAFNLPLIGLRGISDGK